MHQLTPHEASFLYSDTTHSNSNVSLLHIYDQSTAPGGVVRFKSILAHIASRLDRAPLFRRRLQRVPLELDHPYWVEDENFDLEYHVRHIALPKPGDWRQFCIQASRIHARALDLNRPLWEIYVIEGLDSFLDLPEGSFALLVKTHRAAVDVGQAGELTRLLHDDTATPPAAPPSPPWFPESPPGRLAMVCRGAVNTVSSPLRLAAPLARAAAQVAPAVLSLAGERLMHPDSSPVTRFNSVVSPHRVFDTRRFLVTECDEIRALVRGATLVDVMLAVCGGALRSYLDAQTELPDVSLSAIAPRSMEPNASDDVAWLHVPLGTDLADPVKRLAAVHHHTRGADKVARAIGAKSLDDVGQQASAATLSLSRKLIGRVALSLGQRSPLANCTMTHVPGPALPQYLCGARMTYDSAILPIADGMGLVFALTVYDGRVVLSPTSCRELMPDPEAFAQAVRDSFQDYLALARKAPAPALKKTAARAAAVRAKAAPKPATPAKRPTVKPARAARPTPSGRPSRPAPSA
ncbi:MAG: wax ester/triacylglycerol synthase family O-acyltransferase [Ideonella sp.]|nr:wax ester/triacylglycerol synthase family O-acyltransferase [Ideonella sp.]